MGEVLQHLRAAQGVHHFRVELHAIEPAALIGDGGKGRVGAGADHLEALGYLDHPVAMAHPHLVLGARLPHPVEQRRGFAGGELRAAEFALLGRLHAAAQLRHHGLLAITDAQHRNTQLKHPLRCPRRAHAGHAGRPAGQDDRLGVQPVNRRVRLVERHDLRIDAALAHAPRDQLRHLAAEIDNQNAVVRTGGNIGMIGFTHERLSPSRAIGVEGCG